MTLSPVWNETFVFSPGERENGCDGGGGDGIDGSNQWGVLFEIWDHDAHGGGDYLGGSTTRKLSVSNR